LAKRQITDVTSTIIAISTILLLLRFKKLQEPFIIIAAAIAGLLIKYLQ
jgi:chromate transporter